MARLYPTKWHVCGSHLETVCATNLQPQRLSVCLHDQRIPGHRRFLLPAQLLQPANTHMILSTDCVIPPSSLEVGLDRCQWDSFYAFPRAIESSIIPNTRMATLNVGTSPLRGHLLSSLHHAPCTHCAPRRAGYLAGQTRSLRKPSVSSTRSFATNSGKRPRFSQRLGEALRNTKIQWYQIPVGLGIGFLGLVQFYKVSAREQEKQKEIEEGKRPKPRARIRPDGPWYEPIEKSLHGMQHER